MDIYPFSGDDMQSEWDGEYLVIRDDDGDAVAMVKWETPPSDKDQDAIETLAAQLMNSGQCLGTLRSAEQFVSYLKKSLGDET